MLYRLAYSCCCLCIALLASCHGNSTPSSNSARKLIILGIDGMDPVVLKRLMDDGKMPHFKRLQSEGDFKPLATTTPPQSPVAWSTFITGMDPGRHEIYDFIHRDPATLQLYFSTSKAEPANRVMHLGDWIFPLSAGKVTLLRQGTSFWEILQDHGIPATIVRVPANFPPVKSSAVQLSGMGTPDVQGTYGTFAFYTDVPEQYEGASGGTVFPVRVDQQTVRAKLVGPRNDFRKETPAVYARLHSVCRCQPSGGPN